MRILPQSWIVCKAQNQTVGNDKGSAKHNGQDDIDSDHKLLDFKFQIANFFLCRCMKLQRSAGEPSDWSAVGLMESGSVATLYVLQNMLKLKKSKHVDTSSQQNIHPNIFNMHVHSKSCTWSTKVQDSNLIVQHRQLTLIILKYEIRMNVH